MKKQTLKVGLIAIGILLFPCFVNAGRPTGGLWGSYSVRYPSGTLGNSRAEAVRIENLDYPNFDGHLMSVIGQPNEVELMWKGYIHADYDGDYDFRFDMMSERFENVYIGPNKVLEGVSGDRVINNLPLTRGWHRVSIHMKIADVADSQVQFYWTQPGEPEEIVPADHLGYYHWSSDTITIPSDGSEERVDYISAATPGDAGTNEPVIEIDMPVNVINDDAWVIWFKHWGDTNSITISNENNGVTDVVVGTELEGVYAYEGGTTFKYAQTYGKIPSSLIDDGGTGKLRLRFQKMGGEPNPEIKNGIAIIVPTINPANPLGRLSFRMLASSAYHGIGPVITFPVDAAVNNNINPMFLFENGETKSNRLEVPPAAFRPNYLYMLSGTGDPPSVSTILRDQPGAQMIVPEQNPLNINNPNTFYPNHGREGRQIDVVSSKYVPNQWAVSQSQYINQQEGHIDPITIDPTHTWIAFQFIASNFAQDGVDGSGESGSMTGGGLFSTQLLENDLNAVVSGSGTVSSVPGGINCPVDCAETYQDSTVVTLTATPVGAGTFLGWGGACLGVGTDPICVLVMDADQSATATFSMPVPIDGKCGYACDKTHCEVPTEGFCVAPSMISVAGVIETPTGWSWTCEGLNSGASVNCQTEKQCGWVER